MAYLGKTRQFLLHAEAKGASFEHAADQRKTSTEAEKILWNELKSRKLSGYKFRRQHPLKYYIADFYCHEKRLAIEVDGKIHFKPETHEHDENRTAELDRLGITVIRFTNDQVLSSLPSVLESILKTLQSIH
jgi:very-short-patch-repair endonuclease